MSNLDPLSNGEPNLQQWIADFGKDFRAAGFAAVADAEYAKLICRYEMSPDGMEAMPYLFRIVPAGDRLIPLARARVRRHPELRELWEAVLVNLDTPAAMQLLAEFYGTATNENLDSLSTTDLIDIVRRENCIREQLRIRAVGAVLANRDASAHEALVNAIERQMSPASAPDPRPFLSLLLAATVAGRGVVPGLVRLLRDPRLGSRREDIAQALGEIGDPRALETLRFIEQGESNDPQLIRRAEAAIQAIADGQHAS
jgi:HEAT repeat protein